MDEILRVHAVNASSARAFALGIAARLDEDGEVLTLNSATGAVSLRWTRLAEARRFVPVAHADLEPIDADASRGFVDDVAGWLRVVAGADDDRPFEPVSVSLVCLGSGREGVGVTWDGYKLFLASTIAGGTDASDPAEGHYAELFFRLTPDRDQAQLLEKWPAYRVRVPALLELALGLQPHTWHEAPPPELPGLRAAEETLWVAPGVGFGVPTSWVRPPPEGTSVRLHDPTDEYGFEVSVLAVPDGVSAVELLDLSLRGDSNAVGVTAEALPHASLAVATAEHGWESPDPHRDGAPRPARCRWVVAVHAGRMVLITFIFWDDDRGVAVPHLDRAVETLRIDRS